MKTVMRLMLSDEDKAALDNVDFEPEVGMAIRNALDQHHGGIYHRRTSEFLAEQVSKIRSLNPANTPEIMDLMWEVVHWKEDYKSPYTKDQK